MKGTLDLQKIGVLGPAAPRPTLKLVPLGPLRRGPTRFLEMLTALMRHAYYDYSIYEAPTWAMGTRESYAALHTSGLGAAAGLQLL